MQRAACNIRLCKRKHYRFQTQNLARLRKVDLKQLGEIRVALVPHRKLHMTQRRRRKRIVLTELSRLCPPTIDKRTSNGKFPCRAFASRLAPHSRGGEHDVRPKHIHYSSP